MNTEDATALQLTGLKLKLAETIAIRAAAERDLAERELFLQKQRQAMAADGRAAGMSAQDADAASQRVIDWVRRLVASIDEKDPPAHAVG